MGWSLGFAVCLIGQNIDPRSQVTPGYERLSFAWTSGAYDAPNAPWTQLREAGERISATGKGAAFRADAERRFAKTKPTTQRAFQYAVIALNDRLASSQGDYGLRADIAPARLYLNQAPVVRAPEVARLQIMLNSLIEQRPEVVARYSEIVRRFVTKYPNDLNLRYYGSMLLTMSGATSDQLWAIAEAERLSVRWPNSPEARHAGMHSTFVRWMTTNREEDRARAIKAAQAYEKNLLAAHRDPRQPRRVLKVLLKRRS